MGAKVKTISQFAPAAMLVPQFVAAVKEEAPLEFRWNGNAAVLEFVTFTPNVLVLPIAKLPKLWVTALNSMGTAGGPGLVFIHYGLQRSMGAPGSAAVCAA